MYAEAKDYVRRLWTPMIRTGATTLWETPAGDGLDGWCHPWGAAPVGFLLRHVAGLPFAPAGQKQWTLRPRPDLLGRVEARIAAPAGEVEIAWQRDGGAVKFTGRLPEGVEAELIAPGGASLGMVCGAWSKSVGL